MKKTFEAYFDDLHIVTAVLDRHYYDGVSKHFKVIDENNKYLEAVIQEEQLLDDVRIYKIYVEDMVIGENYYLVDEHFLRASIHYRYIVRSDAFDQMFYYNGDDLGCKKTADGYQFKLWAPTASRVLLNIKNDTHEMIKKEKGVFEIRLNEDLDKATYQYLINTGGQWLEAQDPYAVSSAPNHGQSIVVDLNTIQVELNKDKLPPLSQKTDSIIYELHVRDFSVQPESGIENKGKFLGLTEEHTQLNGQITGLDYLMSLGVTHIQLLPIYDFGSVDELNQFSAYNWGYDPVQYNVPEGSYVTDVNNPYLRISELKTMVAKLHEKGLRVIMDVVYNHMFDRFTSSFENIVPYYYFRQDPNGKISNGSFCGNDFDSTRKMGRKYIIDSIKHWMHTYGIDGFRFDLMGILDIDTMNQIAETVKAIDETAMVYGEGWNMPTLLSDDIKATMMNQHQLPYIGHFNDWFRDALKGGSMEDQEKVKGIALGDLKNLSQITDLMLGSNKKEKEEFFDAPWKSVNYVECHDNQTVYDKMVSCEIPVEELVPRQKLLLAMVIFSKGIPFIHAGQEFCRTKKGAHNSYMLSDDINQIDWHRKNSYEEVVQFTRDAIETRKTFDGFRKMNYEENKSKIKKFKKIAVIQYDQDLEVMINFGKATEIKLKKQEIVFNKEGKTSITDKYNLQPLELIVLKRA
ncbi:MAG: type I pullulanase [Clostridia bacterium]|nr:type I pullulanase [Clostridia bacterium]